MKFVKSDPRPEICIDFDVLAKIQQFYEEVQKGTPIYWFMMILECEQIKNLIRITNVNMPKQTTSTYNLSAKKEEISPYCVELTGENGIKTANYGLIKSENEEKSKEMSTTDINRMVELSGVKDGWFIVGKVSKPKKGNIELVLYYVDLSMNIAFCYRAPNDEAQADKRYTIIYPIVEEKKYVEDIVKTNLVASSYVSNVYTGYNSYDTGKYNVSQPYGQTIQRPSVEYPPSELNKKDPDISSVV